MSGPAWHDAVATLAAISTFDVPDALTRIEAVTVMLSSCPDPEGLDAVADALPQRIAGLAPEVGLALAKLGLELSGHHPRIPVDLDAVSPRLRAAWIGVLLVSVDDPARLDEIDDASLLYALGDASIDTARAPALVFDRLARAVDPRLRAKALERWRGAADHLALPPDRACALVFRLAADRDPELRRLAYASLSDPHFARLSPANRATLGRLVQSGLEDDDHEIARLSVELAAALGAREELLELALDDRRATDRRSAAIEGLGPLARDEDLDAVLELLLGDPLRFGACVRNFILATHRHGVFVRDRHLPSVLVAFDTHHEWTGEELVRVTHIARASLVPALARLPAHDRRWIRRATILAASLDIGAHELIATLLRTTEDPRIAAALIDAAGRSPDFTDETALLAWLPRLPEAVLAVLRVRAGAAAVERLRALVGDRRCPASLRGPAMDALWAHSSDRASLLRELCTELGPRFGGLLDAARLSTRDVRAAAILLDAPWPDDPTQAIDPLAALRVLCESADPRCLAEVTRRFRALFGETVRAAVAGDFTIKRRRMPELEQLIYRYGRHMIADGRSVRRWIDDAPDTGRELILALAIDWLREDPPAPIAVALLETLTRQQPTGVSLRRIEPLWRHREPEVRRAALEAILSGREGARGLELSIGRLTDADDPRIVRQALEGVRTFRARWAEPMVIAALARPEMLIKRTAAETLAVIGSHRCVPALVEWLKVHDNQGFRADLLGALRAVADSAALAILVDALAEADQAHHRALLRAAISGLLSVSAALRLARADRPVLRELVDAALAGEVALADGSSESLAAALHRAKLRRPPIADEDPTRRLRLEGFSPVAALDLLAAPELERSVAVLTVVRGALAEWLAWLTGEVPPTPPASTLALELVLEASTPAHEELFDVLLDLCEAALDGLAPKIVVDFLERCVLASKPSPARRARALAVVRGLPISADVGGRRRFALLAELGAVRDRADLDRCLAACRVGPEHARESEALLHEALAIPPARRDEPERITRLRAGAEAWYRTDRVEAEAWLSAMLAERPVDLPVACEWPPPASEQSSFVPSSRADLDTLLAALHDAALDRAARGRAAELLLAWPEVEHAADAWAQVLEIYLAGAIELSARAMATLAGSLDAWPEPSSQARAGRLEALFVHLDIVQRRRFLPAWLRAWEREEPGATQRLQALEQELLIPHARARAEAGEYGLLRLLRHDDSLALRELVERVGPSAPDEVGHLVDPDSVRKFGLTPEAVCDPVASLDLAGLVDLVDGEPAHDLAVRAIHALTRFDEAAADALERFTLDRRPRVRSAALRALRKVAPRERSLAAAVAVLEIETRRDVIASLIASIGHGRHRPGLPRLVSFVLHRDAKVRRAADHALLAWGLEILPDLRRAASKARPDRRRNYEELIAAIERG